jgi:hypothetical protein
MGCAELGYQLVEAQQVAHCLLPLSCADETCVRQARVGVGSTCDSDATPRPYSAR